MAFFSSSIRRFSSTNDWLSRFRFYNFGIRDGFGLPSRDERTYIDHDFRWFQQLRPLFFRLLQLCLQRFRKEFQLLLDPNVVSDFAFILLHHLFELVVVFAPEVAGVLPTVVFLLPKPRRAVIIILSRTKTWSYYFWRALSNRAVISLNISAIMLMSSGIFS